MKYNLVTVLPGPIRKDVVAAMDQPIQQGFAPWSEGTRYLYSEGGQDGGVPILAGS